uniref:Uncharacterized protein n=1 Tax=Taenia asiatica TaxID=60517 RepID=A0A0R3W3G3_TAEAS
MNVVVNIVQVGEFGEFFKSFQVVPLYSYIGNMQECRCFQATLNESNHVTGRTVYRLYF